MRVAVLLGTLLVAAGCGSGSDDSSARAAKAPFARCTHASGGFRACTVFSAPGERSALYRSSGSGWVVVRGRLPGKAGWWRRVIASPDGLTLLAQWSGECELQSTYLVSPDQGGVRPVFAGHPSEALGWTRAGLARVQLAEPIWHGKTLLYRTGAYLVDPRTMTVRLARSTPAMSGC